METRHSSAPGERQQLQNMHFPPRYRAALNCVTNKQNTVEYHIIHSYVATRITYQTHPGFKVTTWETPGKPSVTNAHVLAQIARPSSSPRCLSGCHPELGSTSIQQTDKQRPAEQRTVAQT